MRGMVVFVSIYATLAGCRKANELPPALGAENIPITFTTGNGWEYDGRIELPEAAARNGYAVMIIGGGMGSPIDWEVPGDFTFDGKSVRSGDTISRALLDAGFVVMRWQAIHRHDPAYAEDGTRFAPPDFPQTIEQAKKALAAFRAKQVVADDRIFLLGHSLGAKRAALVIEDYPQTPGVVLLAGASLVPGSLDNVKATVAETLGGDPTNRHEAAVELLRAQKDEWLNPATDPIDKYGFRWPVAILAESTIPVLAIAGTEDEPAVLEAYVLTLRMRERQHAAYDWKVYDRLGHYLDRKPDTASEIERRRFGKLVGPLEQAVVKDVVRWLRSRVEGRRSD